MTQRAAVALLVGLLAAELAAPTQASILGTVQVKTSTDIDVVMQVTFADSDYDRLSVYVGRQALTYQDGGLDNVYGPHHLGKGAFCIEPQPVDTTGQFNEFHIVPVDNAPSANGPRTPDQFGAMGEVKADQLAALWGQFYHLIDAPDADHAQYAANVLSAAFQLAVWEILWEDDRSAWDVHEGLFHAEARTFTARATNLSDGDAALSLANGWLGQLDTNPGAPRARLVALTHADYQDYIVQVVPEPASLAIWSLLGAGCLAMGCRRWRTAK